MKKFCKPVIAGLMVGMFTLSASACVKNEPFVPPDTDGQKVTINDAYDWNEDKTGSNRPNLGGDYEAQLPPTDSVVTIAAGSPVRFKGGKTQMTLQVGKLLSQNDFDLSTLGGRTLGGFAVLNEENISSFIEMNDFVPVEDVTILPYFIPEHGTTQRFGGQKVGDYMYNGDFSVDFTEDPAYVLTSGNALIDGLPGIKIDTENEFLQNYMFRCVTPVEREVGQEYTHYFTFENYGEETLSFTVYQMLESYRWDIEEKRVASEVITIPAGGIARTAIEVKLNKRDNNTLTAIKFESDAHGFSLGVHMARENTTPTQPAKITLDLPEGFTVSEDYKTDVRTNDKLVLPTAAQIKNETGNKFLYWADAEGNKLTEGVRITGDMTIKPVLTQTITVTLQLPEGFTVSSDYNTTYQTGDKLILPTEAQITNNTGRKFIRWADGDGNPVTNGMVLNANLTLVAEMAQPARISVKLPTGLTLSDKYQTESFTGETITVPQNDMVSGTIADGRTIEGWYSVATGEVITENTIIDSAVYEIAPYFSRRDGTAVLTGFKGEEAQFNGKPLVFCNVQTSNKPMNVYNAGDVTTDKFTAIPKKMENVIGVGGGDGYAELGTVLQFNGKLPAGMSFRCGSKISDGAAVVKLNAEHTFYYNFQNFGAKTMHFKVRGVNSGANVEGPETEITLAPGESICISFKVAYKNGGDNKNIMLYFTLPDGAENMKLGVSVNVELAKVKATVALKSGIEGFTLSEDYLGAERFVGGKLVLPTADDYTDTQSADRKVIGWKDGSGNHLTDGATINGNITLEPVFSTKVTVTLKEGFEGFALTQEYLNRTFWTGDKLILPTADDYTDTQSANRGVIGWQDGEGNALDGETVISGNVVLVPVFEQYVTVTYELPEGLTFKGEFPSSQKYVVGDKLILPSEEEIENTLDREILYWIIKGTATRVTSETVVEQAITVVPVLQSETQEAVTITLTNAVQNFTVAQEYFDAVQYKDGLLVLPTEAQITNGTGDKFLGWVDGEGNELTADTVIIGNIVLVPVFAKRVAIIAAQVEGFEISSEYLDKPQYFGDNLVLPEDGEFTNNTGKRFTGWTDGEGNALTADYVLEDENLVLTPVLEEYIKVTLNLPEGLTVKDGYKVNYVAEEALNLPEVLANTTGMGDVAGWYDVNTLAFVTASTKVTANMTIAPYWKSMGGYSYVDIGTGANSGYNTDNVPGEYAAHLKDAENKTASYKGSAKPSKNKGVIVRSENGFAVLGAVLKDTAKVYAGSAIRFDSERTAPKGNYEFSYTVDNRGSSALRLSVYQINKGVEYNVFDYAYEGTRYRTEIVVAAGEIKTVKGQYELDINGNWLTYLVFEQDMEGFEFGISIGFKAVDAIGDEYKNQAALVNPAAIDYNTEENGGITVDESWFDIRAGKYILAPASDKVTVPASVTLEKWQLVIDGVEYDLPSAVAGYGSLRVPSGACALKAVYLEVVDLTVTYNEVNGVTAAGAKTAYKTGEKLELPALAASTTDGRVHKGWFDTVGGTVVTADTAVTQNMTLAPLFANPGTELIALGANGTAGGATAGEDGCAYGPDKLKGDLLGKFAKTEKIVGDMKGIVLDCSAEMAVGNAFRFKTGSTIASGKTYKFTYTFTNLGEEAIEFTVYQVASSDTTAGMDNEKVVLEAGASITVELTLTAPAANNNALTYFVMDKAASNLSLGVAMSYAEETAAE